jgi:very-short-patch-repair endonuclease
MTIVGAGLPRHEVQEPVLDTDQTVPARPDLAYPAARLGIEYDGATHRVSLVEDNRRQNMLLRRFGIVLLRYTASDVHRPATIVEDIRSMLNAPSAGFR